MIKLLIDVCTSKDVARANKIIAINIIGELVIFIGVNFKPYLLIYLEYMERNLNNYVMKFLWLILLK